MSLKNNSLQKSDMSKYFNMVSSLHKCVIQNWFSWGAVVLTTEGMGRQAMQWDTKFLSYGAPLASSGINR